jgi:Co/Zn/Cd efflux system component
MGCCDHDSEACRAMAASRYQRQVLWLVLAVNVVIFAGEFLAGFMARSSSVQGDSLDSLGDALVYGLSLMVVGKSLGARAAAAAVKGALQLAFAVAVLGAVAHRYLVGVPPVTPTMAMAAAGALVLNGSCLALLWRFRHEDLNMRSVWLCSRNDVVGNAGVLVVAGAIALSGWWWLDLLFGGVLAALFFHTGWHVLRAAIPDLGANRVAP